MLLCAVITFVGVFTVPSHALTHVAFLIFDSNRTVLNEQYTFAQSLYASLMHQAVSQDDVRVVTGKQWSNKLENLPRTHGDSEKRVKWRSKLVLDYIGAMRDALQDFSTATHICRLEVGQEK